MAEHKTQADDLIKWMEDIFKKVPHLPTDIKDVIIKLAPILSIVFGILGLLGGISAVGLSPVALFGGITTSAFVLITGAFAIVSSVLVLMAAPKLSKHAYAGWRLLFWAQVISVVASLITFTFGAVIWSVVCFYLLFEIKGHYK